MDKEVEIRYFNLFFYLHLKKLKNSSENLKLPIDNQGQ